MSDQPDEGTSASGDEPTGPAEGQDFPRAPSTNPLAIVAFASAIGGLILWPVAVIAIVVGVISLRQIEERGEGGRRLARIAIVVGVVSLVLTVLAIVF